MKIITVQLNQSGQRLDQAIVAATEDLSRSRVQALIKEGCVTVDGRNVTDASAKVKEGMQCRIEIPDAISSVIVPENIPLDIVFEDAHLLVINKPAGMTVHPAVGNREGTLVHALLHHCGDTLSGIGGVARPGIVHRLDKDTSGLMVVAKHDAAHQHLSAQLAKRTLKRVYQALVWGRMAQLSGTLEGAISRSHANRKKMAVVKDGKPARTHYEEIESFWTESIGKRPSEVLVSVVECRLETGRTHQIRVHFAHAGHGLVGDALYGATTGQRLKHYPETSISKEARHALLEFPRQALHALEIGFIHPILHEHMSFSAPVPQDIKALISNLKT
ncbi:MAG: RluA family pseudouridine synthase [Rickettsiales bacterium]